MHHSKHSHSGKHSTRHCSITFQLKSKLKYILIIEILDQDPHSYWALNPEFESLLCLILNPVLFSDVLGNGTPLQYSCLENPMDGGAWWAAVHGVAQSRTWLSDFTFTFHFSLSCIGEGNGNPLQCSCLENSRDREAWWAAVCGVAQSRRRLKRLSSSSSMEFSVFCLGFTVFY